MNDELVKFDNLISYTAPNVVIKKLKNREIVFEFLCQKLTEKWSIIFNLQFQNQGKWVQN